MSYLIEWQQYHNFGKIPLWLISQEINKSFFFFFCFNGLISERAASMTLPYSQSQGPKRHLVLSSWQLLLQCNLPNYWIFLFFSTPDKSSYTQLAHVSDGIQSSGAQEISNDLLMNISSRHQSNATVLHAITLGGSHGNNGRWRQQGSTKRQ